MNTLKMWMLHLKQISVVTFLYSLHELILQKSQKLQCCLKNTGQQYAAEKSPQRVHYFQTFVIE